MFRLRLGSSKATSGFSAGHLSKFSCLFLRPSGTGPDGKNLGNCKVWGQEQKGPGATAPKFAVWLLRAVFDGELIAQVLCCVIIIFVKNYANTKATFEAVLDVRYLWAP